MSKSISTPIDVAAAREQFVGLGKSYPPHPDVAVEPVVIAGVRCFWLTPDNVSGDEIIIYFHGGGYIYGSFASHGAMVSHIAHASERRVLFVDYSLAPEHPFPKAIEEAVAVINQVHRDSPMVRYGFAGDSAGGGLVYAVAIALAAQAQGGLRPAFHVAISPWTDLCVRSPSYAANAAVDPIISKEFSEYAAKLYLAGHSATDPLASPVYGDYHGFSRSLILCGSREVLEDDSRNLHRVLLDAGVDSTLTLFEGSTHVWPLKTIESDASRAALRAIGDHIRRPPSLA
jgi:acetyl esterase/lipase